MTKKSSEEGRNEQQKKSIKPRKSTSKVGESSKSSSGLQREEISSDECSVCLGAGLL